MKKQEKSELHRWTHPHLLKGKLRTSDGFAMSPSSTHRPLTKRSETKQKRLVRYYISQKAIKHGFKTCPVKSINAEHLDELVRGLVLRYINKDDLVKQPQSVRDRWIRRVIESVTLDTDQVAVSLLSEQIDRLRSHKFKAAPSETPAYPSCLQMPKIEDCGKTISLTLRIQIKKLDGRRLLLSPDGSDLIIPSNPVPQQHIVDAIGQAYRWHNELIRSGTTIRAYAEQHRIARSRMIELLPLTQLGPEALRHALAGTLPSTITLDDLIAASKRLDWDLQVTELGIRSAS